LINDILYLREEFHLSDSSLDTRANSASGASLRGR
jgi:hypothetical protein